MLYILTGPDTMKAKSRAAALAKGHEVVRFGEGAESFANVLGHLGARGLFSKKIALLLDTPSESEDGVALISEHAKDFAEADMLVIVVESDISSDVLKNLRMIATIEEFELEGKEEMPVPSVFALTDAFASGNRKDAWVLYRKIIASGSAPEEVHGALSWQARAMVLAAKTKSASEAGLKPFVYSKSKRAAETLGPERAEGLSRELVRLLHESRMGGGNLEGLLEAFLLKK